ncbi:hypothetical protein [Paracoccus sp. (in: a-proteobacteria)]|uniref:hypothetical protein n=1 Tax=Paracoccus sp. TaxID=267 RepID=UPI00396C4A14
MKLTLHIGTEKTGTTSLQKWMAANRAELLKQGVFYPKSLGSSRHIKASVFASDFVNGDKIAYRIRGIEDEEALVSFRNRLRQQFHAEVADARANGYHHCFISDEGLQAVLRNQDELLRLKSSLLSVFDDIQIIICLRPQIDYGLSLASTFSRLGFTINRKWLSNVSPEFPRFNYNALVHAWEEIFGADAVKLVSYKNNPRSIPLFKQILGLSNEGASWTEVERENSFVDWRYIRLINKAQGEERNHLRSVLDQLPHFQKLELGKEAARTIARQFDESNGRLVNRRVDIALADLGSDEETSERTGNFAKLEETFDDDGLAYDLIKRMTSAT